MEDIRLVDSCQVLDIQSVVDILVEGLRQGMVRVQEGLRLHHILELRRSPDIHRMDSLDMDQVRPGETVKVDYVEKEHLLAECEEMGLRGAEERGQERYCSEILVVQDAVRWEEQKMD